MKFDVKKLEWIRKPKQYNINQDKIIIVTEPETDLWQRTYYGFQNDNAPVLQIKSNEKYFSFVVKTEFDSKKRFDEEKWLNVLNEMKKVGLVPKGYGNLTIIKEQ